MKAVSCCETRNACYLRLLTAAHQWQALHFGEQRTGRGGQQRSWTLSPARGSECIRACYTKRRSRVVERGDREKKVAQSERGLWNWSIWDLTGLFFPLELRGRAPSRCKEVIKSRITSSCGEVRVMLLIGRLSATTSGSSQRDSSRRHLCPAEVFELCHPIFISDDDFLTWLRLCVVTFLWNSYLLFCLQSTVDLEGDLPRPVISETMVDCASRSPSPAAAASEHGEVQQWGVSHSPQPLRR